MRTPISTRIGSLKTNEAARGYQARLLNTIIATVFGVTASFVLTVLLFMRPIRLERLLFVAVLLLPFLAAVFMNRSRRTALASVIAVGALWGVIILTAVTGGGIRAPGIPALVVPVALAGLLLGWRVGVVYMALTLTTWVALTAAELAGWQPTRLDYDAIGTLSIQAAILVFVVVLVSLADREIKGALAASQLYGKRFQQTFDNAPIGMALVGLDERILQANRALSEILGFSVDELITKTIDEITYPDDNQREVALKNTTIQAGSTSFTMEKRYVHRDGHLIWGKLSVSLVRDESGNPSYYIGQLEDITEQRRADERIQKLNRTYQLLSNVNQTIVRTGDLQDLFPKVCQIAVDDGGFVLAWVGLVNPSSRTMELAARHGAAGDYLRSGDGVLGKDNAPQEPAAQAILDEDAAICNDITSSTYPEPWRAWAKGVGARSAAAFPLAVRGEVRGVFNLLSAEPDAFDEAELKLLAELALDLSYAMEVAENESSRRQAEEQLSNSEERYRHLAEDMPVLICTYLPDSTLTYVNTAYCEYYQQRTEDLIGRRFLDFLPDEAARQATRAQYISLTPQNSKTMYEDPVIAQDGSERWQQWVDRAFFDPSGEAVAFQSVGLDVTERKLAEAALRASEKQYRDLVNSLGDVIFVVDVKGHIQFLNSAVKEMAGYEPDDLLGRSFIEFVHPDDLPLIARLFQQTMQGLSREEIAGAEAEVEGRLIKRNGDALWMTMRGSVVQDSQGAITGFRGVVRDITERRLAEMRRIEAETLRIELEKERELGALKTRFVSMVSHEFRTPLAMISMAGSMLQMYQDKLSEARKEEKLKLIQSQVKRLEAILEDTLFITRDELGKLKFAPTQINLEQFVRELAQDVELLGQSQRIVVSADGHYGSVAVDTNLLRHILINLLSNALKYSPDDQNIRFSLDCIDGQVIFQVQDQGIGIPPEDLRHLFEPFYRAENVGEISGTGLGLAIVKRSVEAHHGTIHVMSEVGQGTTVTVSLPIDSQTSEIE